MTLIICCFGSVGLRIRSCRPGHIDPVHYGSLILIIITRSLFILQTDIFPLDDKYLRRAVDVRLLQNMQLLFSDPKGWDLMGSPILYGAETRC